MSTPDTEMSLPERCTAQARSMELEGWYVCANVLNAAADRIAELEKEVERWRALLIATEHDSERRYDWWTAERDRRKAAEQRVEKLTEALGQARGNGAGISHADICRLSRSFNETANLQINSPDYRINEWLKKQIAKAFAAEAALSNSEDGNE